MEQSRGDKSGNFGLPAIKPSDVLVISREKRTALENTLSEQLKDGNFTAAVRSLDTLVDSGICPSDIACNKLINGLVSEAKLFHVIWHVYLLAKAQGVLLRYHAHQAVLSSATRARQHNSALVVFQAMKASGLKPNVITYCTIISSLARSKQPALIRTGRRLWSELRTSGLELDAAAYRTGANMCVESGDLPAAQGVIGEMRAAGVSPDTQTYNILMKGYARGGMLSQLPNLVADMQMEGLALNRVSYTTLVEGYANAGQLSTAESWAAAAVVCNAPSAGASGDWLHTALVKARVQAGDLPAAEAQLQKMISTGDSPPLAAWSQVIDGYVHAGQLKDAREVLKRMQRTDVQINAQCWNILMRGYADRGGAGRHGVLWCIRQMEQSGVGPDTSSFNTLMAAALKQGDTCAAFKYHEELRSRNCSPDVVTFTILMKAHSHMRDIAKVTEVFRQLDVDSKDLVDLVALSAYIDALCKAGHIQQASRLLKRANNLAASAGLPPPLTAHSAVMSGHARRRDFVSASKALQDFIDLGGTPNARMYNTLVDTAMRMGDYNKALQVVRAMENRGHTLDRSRFKDLFTELCRREQSTAGIDNSQTEEVPKDVPNEALERFKWLLGLKNTYYSQH